MAKDSESMMETVYTIHEMTEDEKIREQCEARERYERDWSTAIAASEKRGEARGELLKLISLARKKIVKQISEEECAELLEEDLELVKRIYEQIKANPDQSDVEISKLVKR